MLQSTPFRAPTCCWRSFVRSVIGPSQQTRSFVNIQFGPVEKLDVPSNIPERFWSQLPKRLRPDNAKRQIIIHEQLPSEREACKEPAKSIEAEQMELLDPTGARARLFNPKTPDGAKAGDIILATFKTGEPFSGVALSIKWRGPHTSVLLRNQVTRVGTEMDVKVFSPLVQSMEIAQKATKRPRRARLFYMRQPKHDVGSVQKTVDQYLRQRATLMGGKTSQGRKLGGNKGGKRSR